MKRDVVPLPEWGHDDIRTGRKTRSGTLSFFCSTWLAKLPRRVFGLSRALHWSGEEIRFVCFYFIVLLCTVYMDADRLSVRTM